MAEYSGLAKTGPHPTPTESPLTRALLTLLPLTLLVGCAASQTKVVSTWKDSETSKLDCDQTIVLFPSKNATMRAIVEDKIAARMQNGVRARSVVDTATSKDPVALKSVLQARGFDCGVVVKFVGLDTETEYVAGRAYAVPSSYHNFYNYYGSAWTTFYDPGYVTEKRILVLDTNVYDIEADKLVWAARSRTVEPDQAEDMIDDLVDEMASAMRKDGLID